VPKSSRMGPRTPRLGALGSAIREMREAAGLSQVGLGTRIGIQSTQVSALERGRENPGYERLIEVAGALETPLTDLVRLAEKLYDEDVRGNPS
jgi:transcriptional regulator with XRE-family HTH domain